MLVIYPSTGRDNRCRAHPWHAHSARAIITTSVDVSMTDHHSEYLAKTIAALTPEGHKRVDELMEQLADTVGSHEAVARFAAARKAEARVGWREGPVDPDTGRALTTQELDVLTAGFRTIRDQEPLDDVADWANAIVPLLEDEADRSPSN
jgi:hypothetical protein